MTEPIRFDGISLPVSDVDRSVAFYQQFSFELLIRHDDFALLRLGVGGLPSNWIQKGNFICFKHPRLLHPGILLALR